MGKAEQGSCSLPRGVTLRQHKTGSMLVITFAFKGVLCRELLSKVDISPRGMKYAERLLGEIQNQIAGVTFDYSIIYPRLQKAGTVWTGKKIKIIKSYLDEYLKICENRNLSSSTINGYEKCLQAFSSIHKLQVTDLTPSVLKKLDIDS